MSVQCKCISQTLLTMTCASLLSVAVSLSSWASDLDIYLGSGNDTVTYKPNVLFIIDTSGSMSNQDGTGKTRLLRVQQALNEALSGATNINAGLMRFSNKGGSILHPVTDIDRFVPPQLIDTVQSGADDATSINGEMQISTNQLQIARGTQTVTTGLRFVELNIPQGAQITKASLRFASAFSNTEPVDIKIYGELNGDAQNYAVGAAVHERAKTTHFVEWNSDNTFSFSGEYISTPDITSVIQEVVNQPSWCGRNNIGLIIAATGLNAGVSRAAYAFEQGNGLAPQLVIEYDDTTATGCVAGTMTYRITSQDENAEERGNGHQSTGSEFTFQNTSNEHIPSPASYLPPVTDLQCQTNNHIVLLSDGEANNNHSVSKIQSLLGKTCQSSSSEHCGLDLVRELSQTNTSPLNARVITHTIGFVANATANNFLNQLALNGGGGFYQTDNSEELVDVFQQILRTVKDINATFVSPGVAVNQLNPLTHRDELYFALFKPSEGTLWPGNLKQYKIQGNTILDQNNANAVDGSTGFFSEYAHSFWSTLADGNAVGEGGAASKLGLSRNIYTFSTPGNIVAPENQLHEDNTSINTRDLALGSLPEPDTLRTKVLKWARGVDVRDYDGDGNVTEARRQMGAPIHSQPVIVNYGTDDSAILVATNHGFLHSFDTTTGAENFAVIPRELLSNLYDFYQDGSSFNHIYGLDGSLVLRRVGDKTYLYVGMRRGGQNYYAFDISEKDNPKLVFKIKGGEADFTQLGQTWSQPTLTKIKISDTIRDVMIIGGGYDDSQDDKLLRAPDSQGNAIYIVDANTGAKILTISQSTSDLNVATMLYGIPGRISSVDRDNDGLVDHLYAADMGGQLFRFDIYNGEVGTDLIKGQRIADLGGDDESNHRRFVYGPDVTEVIGQGKPYFAITIGSGHRADPLGLTIDDRFYMLRDEGVFKRDEYGRFRFFDSVLSESDLYDATEHLLNSSDNLAQEHAKSELNSKNGWRFSLTRNGEKVLSSPLLLDYQIFFTTYTPSAGSDSLCASPTGHSRAYLIDLFTANAVTDLDRDKTIDVYDRSAQLSQTGIAPDPKMLIENIVTPVICIGAECESAVFEYDNDGNEIECQGEFACLVRNIYGRFKRVQQQSWRTDIERQ